jgi:hypothetical protein
MNLVHFFLWVLASLLAIALLVLLLLGVDLVSRRIRARQKEHESELLLEKTADKRNKAA